MRPPAGWSAASSIRRRVPVRGPGRGRRVEREQGAVGFDANDARYPHRDRAGRCSFEALVEEYLPYDAALRELGLSFITRTSPGTDCPLAFAVLLGALTRLSRRSLVTGRFSPGADGPGNWASRHCAGLPYSALERS